MKNIIRNLTSYLVNTIYIHNFAKWICHFTLVAFNTQTKIGKLKNGSVAVRNYRLIQFQMYENATKIGIIHDQF